MSTGCPVEQQANRTETKASAEELRKYAKSIKADLHDAVQLGFASKKEVDTLIHSCNREETKETVQALRGTAELYKALQRVKVSSKSRDPNEFVDFARKQTVMGALESIKSAPTVSERVAAIARVSIITNDADELIKRRQ